MKTGNEYRQTLRDGRLLYLDGARVPDAVSHPLLRPSVDWIAQTYDSLHETKPGASNPVYSIPRSRDELRAQMALITAGDLTLVATAGCMTLAAIAAQLPGAEYAERVHRFIATCRTEDKRVAIAQENPGVDVRVVDRTHDGIVIRGYRHNVLGAALVHELIVVPSSPPGPDDGDLAVACAVPVSTPGVRVVSTTTAPRSKDTRHYPISRRASMPAGFVIFDNVFVPWERVFLLGEVGDVETILHALGVNQRARAVADQADRADLYVGLARMIAEMNGVLEAGHIQNKLASMAVWATMCRAGWEAALVNAGTMGDGMVCPADAAIYAARHYGSHLESEMVGYLHDIAGGLVMTAPSLADFDNPDTGKYVEKYIRTMEGVSALDRLRVFHMIRDLTADAYGGWAKVTNQLVGGGIDATRRATLLHYDFEAVTARVRSLWPDVAADTPEIVAEDPVAATVPG